MINRVVLTGRLTRDPDVKSTSSGIAVASFTLAVDRQFRGQDGSRDADFINCVAWRKRAEALAQYTHKGSLIGVEGRLQTRSYQDKQGNNRQATELVIDNFAFLNSKKDVGNQNSESNHTFSSSKQADPFKGAKGSSDDGAENISADDLPF